MKIIVAQVTAQGQISIYHKVLAFKLNSPIIATKEEEKDIERL